MVIMGSVIVLENPKWFEKHIPVKLKGKFKTNSVTKIQIDIYGVVNTTPFLELTNVCQTVLTIIWPSIALSGEIGQNLTISKVFDSCWFLASQYASCYVNFNTGFQISVGGRIGLNQNFKIHTKYHLYCFGYITKIQKTFPVKLNSRKIYFFDRNGFMWVWDFS